MYRIRRNIGRGPRNHFYINVAWFHLPRPNIKLKRTGFVDGYPIIHVDTGRMR